MRRLPALRYVVFFIACILLRPVPCGSSEIKGKVLLDSGAPAGDCDVYVYKATFRSFGIDEDEVIAETRTGASGEFRLSGVDMSPEPYARYYVVAHLGGWAVDWRLLTDAGAGEGIVLGLGESHNITGRILGTGETPLSGGRVSVIQIRREGRHPFVTKSGTFDFLGTMTDERGFFAIEGLPEESVISIEAAHSTYARATLGSAGSDDEDVEIRLQSGGTIKGRITYEKEGAPAPAEGVLVKCRERYSGRGRSDATTGHDGTFEFRGLPAGTYLVEAEFKSGETVPDFVIAHRNDIVVETGKVTEEVSLQCVRGVLIRGTAHEEAAEAPVEGVRLGFFHKGGYDIATSGSEGKYAVRVLPGTIFRKVESVPAGYDVIRSTWSAGEKGKVEGKEGDVLDGVNLVLHKRFGMTITVVDEDGAPVPDTFVYYSERGSGVARSISNSLGKAFVEFSRKGESGLIYAVNEKGRVGAARIMGADEAFGEEMTIKLFKIPVISGAVRDRDGAPVSDASVRCYAALVPVQAVVLRFEVPGEQEVRTDSNGEYVLDKLAPGNMQYQIEVFREGFDLYVSKPFSLPNRDELSYSDIVLVRTDSFLAGKVTDADGNAIESCWVEVYTGTIPKLTRTDKDGTYRIEGLPEGHVTLKIHHPGFGYRTFEDIYTGHENTDLAFERPRVVRRPDVSSPTARAETITGKEAPALEIKEWVEEKGKSPAELKGSVVLLDFFAVWCGPCRVASPEIEKVYKKYKDKGLAVLGIHDDGNSPAEIKGFCEELGLTFPVGIVGASSSEKGKEVYKKFGVEFIPYVVLIDKKGIVRYVNISDGLEEKIEELLGEE